MPGQERAIAGSPRTDGAGTYAPSWPNVLWIIAAIVVAFGVLLSLATSSTGATSSMSESGVSGSSAPTTFPDGVTIDFQSRPVTSYMAEVHKNVDAGHVEPHKEYWVRLGWQACKWGKEGYSRDNAAIGLEQYWIKTIGVSPPTDPTSEAAAYTMSLIVVNSAWSSDLCSM